MCMTKMNFGQIDCRENVDNRIKYLFMKLRDLINKYSNTSDKCEIMLKHSFSSSFFFR